MPEAILVSRASFGYVPIRSLTPILTKWPYVFFAFTLNFTGSGGAGFAGGILLCFPFAWAAAAARATAEAWTGAKPAFFLLFSGFFFSSVFLGGSLMPASLRKILA